ncbi:LexA family transcriptional regulator [Acetobacter sp. KSO5]|uniref:LexA family transcriptional regulator n=1 Tax=Acetobacter sp. KSO5 TaxID=3373674 RepID=UPI00376EF4BF
MSHDKIKRLRHNYRMKYKTLVDRIETALRDSGMSERKLCLTAGVGEHAIRNIRKGHAPKADNLHKIAATLNLPDAFLLEAAALPTPRHQEKAIFTESMSSLGMVYVKGFVQAGLWQEALEWPVVDWKPVYVPSDIRYQDTPRFALQVRGESMNKVYPEGSIVIAIRLWDIARPPKSGERVVVLRRSKSSNEMEATVKKYEISSNGEHILWPESTDPHFQTPIIMDEMATQYTGDGLDADHGSACDIEIYAIVIGSYRPE